MTTSMFLQESLAQFGECWEGLEDPRYGNAGLHDFHELLAIALCCVQCGGHGPTDMSLFARAKESFLRSLLTLANGLPATIRSIGCFAIWIRTNFAIRIETRMATVSTEIGWLQKQHQRPGFKAIRKVVRVRETAEKTTTETAYYLVSSELAGAIQ